MALSVPDQWMDRFNLKLMSPEYRMQLLDVYSAKSSLQSSKMYIEHYNKKNLNSHIFFTLTFSLTMLILSAKKVSIPY